MTAAKTRVAPLTNQSIPRLELLGATISSDSQVILTWIKTKHKKYKQFVENRVIKIRQNSNVKDWEYKKHFQLSI